MKKKVLSTLVIGAWSMHGGLAQAHFQEMQDKELQAVHGGLAILPGVLNIGPLFNLPFVAVNALGAGSLVSGVNIAALSGGTVLNLLGLTGVSGVNALGASGLSGISLLGLSGGSAINLLGYAPLSGIELINGPLSASLISVISLPFGATGASVVTLPGSLNGFGLINAP
ncbi:MAG: hypothetical protein WBN85_10035 [Candidatus Macondimonas sp.]